MTTQRTHTRHSLRAAFFPAALIATLPFAGNAHASFFEQKVIAHKAEVGARLRSTFDVAYNACRAAAIRSDFASQRQCGADLLNAARYESYEGMTAEDQRMILAGKVIYYSQNILPAWIDADGTVRTGDLDKAHTIQTKKPQTVKFVSGDKPIKIKETSNKSSQRSTASHAAIVVKSAPKAPKAPAENQANTTTPSQASQIVDNALPIKARHASIQPIEIEHTTKIPTIIETALQKRSESSTLEVNYFKNYFFAMPKLANNFFQFTLPAGAKISMDNTRVVSTPLVVPPTAPTVAVVAPSKSIAQATVSPATSATTVKTQTTEDTGNYYGLTTTQFKTLPAGIQKLAQSSDPMDGIRFVKEAEANLISRNDPSLISVALEVDRQGIEMAKAMNIETPTVAKLMRDYKVIKLLQANKAKAASAAYGGDTVLIRNGYSINLIRQFNLG